MLLVAAFASVDHYSVNITVKENLEKKIAGVVDIVELPPKNKRWELFKDINLPWSHFKSRLSLIIRVNVVLIRTVVVDSD